MKTFVALLRGVNLGARNKVPMAELRRALEQAGFEDVQTYIQSGNVILRAPAPEAVARDVERLVEKEFGVRSPVVVRTAAELRAVVKHNPFPPHAAHVVFLSAQPPAGAVASLGQAPEELHVRGRDIYLHRPAFHRSRFGIDYFERRLGVTATLRNWRTVVTLAELARARS